MGVYGPPKIPMIPADVVYRGWTEALEKGVEAWKESHDEAMKVRSLEELIPYALSLRDIIRIHYKQDFERLFTNKEPHTQKRGQVHRMLDDLNLGVFKVIDESIRWAEKRGYEVQGGNDFAQAFSDVHRFSDDYSRRWPLFDPDELEKSHAQAERGEFASDEEVWRELQG